MSEIEDKLGAILGNPQLMEQIMGMAQTLGQQSDPLPKKEHAPHTAASLPDLDPAMVGKIMSLAEKTGIDANQKSLLCALGPYLSHQRLQKLEKAMRAARLAGAASSLLQSGAIPFLSGR